MLALGVDVAFKKAQRGSGAVRIGTKFQIDVVAATISATASDEAVQELHTLTTGFLAMNVIPLKSLRSFAGKCSHVATIVDTFRPFLKDLWGAMSAVDADAGDGRGPKGCIWQSRIAHALL